MIDLLIIGSGGAGLTTALSAKAMGARVVVVGKQSPTNSQTSMAQGGINASLGNVGEDSVELHIEDTLKSSKGIADRQMVEILCQQAPDAIEWLESIGVPFSRTTDAKVAQRRLGGASAKRACYSQDYTGLKILHTLYDSCLKEGIEFIDHHYLLNLVTDGNLVKGVTLLNIASGEIEQIDAKSVVVATGGYSSLYHGFTTNAFGSTGDGIAVVARAGGEVSDMEFVQFHPTALKGSSILISESARGEGGYLLNSRGERFVDELLPRDEVARAISEQIYMGLDVFLDIRHLGEEKLLELLPQEIHLCRLHEGVDPIEELIPIKSVAHYSMGGISVDRELRVEGLEGCFGVGECSNARVHGANRLGGNSLLELIVFGKRVASSAMEYISSTTYTKSSTTQLQRDKEDIESIYRYENSINFYEIREYLGEEFYKKVGIVRNGSSLQTLLDTINRIELEKMGIGDKSREMNRNLIEFLEFRNSLEIAQMVLTGAIDREESRGAHYREDFPLRDGDKLWQR
jgi:succinate dehydrogenase / fumarate reductase flavoprotein subunit